MREWNKPQSAALSADKAMALLGAAIALSAQARRKGRNRFAALLPKEHGKVGARGAIRRAK